MIVVQQTLCIESKLLAEDLYTLIKSFDPQKWRSDLDQAARELLAAIEARLKKILAHQELWGDDRRLVALRDRLRVLAKQVNEFRARGDLSTKAASEWRAFLRRLRPTYQSIAASMRANEVDVANLRPANYKRNATHIFSGVMSMVLFHHVLTLNQTLWAAGGFAVVCWILETSRRYNHRINAFLMRLLGFIAHPHEHHRVNSATWFSTSLFFLAAFTPRLSATVALAVLTLADPMAGIIGRRYGTILIRAGRSLEGTAAFFVTGTLAAFFVLALYFPELSWGCALQLALVGAALGALAELFSWRVDDNVAIPVVVGIGVSLAGYLLL